MACSSQLGSISSQGRTSLLISRRSCLARPGHRATQRALRPRAASDIEGSKVAKAAAVAGLVANPVVLVSEFFLKTRGEGLPPGPGGIYGATEGVSYLVVVGIAAWSLYKKVKTGSGLPGTLLGAAEGLSFLSIVAGIVVAGLEIAEKGSLPGITGR